MATPNLDDAARFSLNSDQIIGALDEIVELAEYGKARLTMYSGGGASVAIGGEHNPRIQYAGKTVEEALCKAQAAILKGRRRG
jgi:hypothetical protein